jgi:hypothetical protein
MIEIPFLFVESRGGFFENLVRLPDLLRQEKLRRGIDTNSRSE